jgi:hypothetical protein
MIESDGDSMTHVYIKTKKKKGKDIPVTGHGGP